MCHRQAWARCEKEQEGGKERVRLGQPFCWSPKQINQGLLEHTNWITQMGLGKEEGGDVVKVVEVVVVEGYTHSRAATKQQPGWADLSFRHFLKLIIHAGPSSIFFYPLICPSVFLCLSVSSTLSPATIWLFLFFHSCVSLFLTLLNEPLFSLFFLFFFFTPQFPQSSPSPYVFSYDISCSSAEMISKLAKKGFVFS